VAPEALATILENIPTVVLDEENKELMKPIEEEVRSVV
jgi:hypothetical protein